MITRRTALVSCAAAAAAAAIPELVGVFADNIRIAGAAGTRIPVCNVLFFYGTLEPSTRLAGQEFSFRDMVKAAGAHIAVLASEPSSELLDNEDFLKTLGKSGDWYANV